jgi:hypothetical protein
MTRSELSAVLGTRVEHLVHWIGDNPCDEYTRLESQYLLIRLLSFIHAPHDLKFFGYTIECIHEVFLELIQRITHQESDELKKRGIDLVSLAKIVTYLFINRDELVERFGEELLLNNDYLEGGSHPMRSKLKYFYIYAMLMNTHESRDYEAQLNYRALQGYVLISHALLVSEGLQLQVYLLSTPERKYLDRASASGENASREVRNYSLEGYDSNDLLELGSLSSVIKSMVNIGDLEPSAKKKLCSYLALGFGKRVLSDTRKGHRGSSYSHTFRGWSDGFIRFGSGQSHEKHQTDDTSAIIISPRTGDAERNNILSDLGLDTAENQGGDELILIDNTDKKAGRLFTRAQVRHVVMSNQMFRNQWSQATVYELTKLMRACGEQIRANDTSELRREVISLVMIMLWTSSTLESAKSNFRWLNTGRALGQQILGYEFDSSRNIGSWKITPHTPTLKKSPTRKEKSYCRVKESYLELPDPFKIGNYIIKTFPEERLKDSKNSLFNRKVKTYRDDLRLFLHEITGEHRLNEFKISRYLFYKIASERQGDIADAILITGRYHPLGQTLLHYTSSDKERLQQIYLMSVADVVSKIYSEGYLCETPTLLINPPRNTNTVGSNLCPTVDAVGKLILNLQQRITAIPAENENVAIIEYHNWFTLYTIQMIGYATGYRAIVDPFPVDSEIDEESGLAVISDKDGPDYYNSRVVWVPKSVREQILNYMTHRAKILPLIAGRHPRLVFNEEEKQLSRIFLLENDFKPTEIRPSALSPLLADYLPLPLNVNRRFLRTELRARNCPSEVVDAFMGHWSRGQEPWGQYSSLSIIEIVETLKVYIEAILVELKLEPIKSRFL